MHSIDIPQETKLTKRVFAMAGSSFFNYVWKVFATLAIVIPFLALSGCGKGDGPTSIPNTLVPPLNLPPGFCDSINFEIECEPPEIIWFGGGQTIIVNNVDDVTDPNTEVNLPDPTGINPSDRFARMQKFGDQPFGGTRLNPVDVPVNFAAGESYKIKVWSEREVRVLFKLEETNDGTLGIGKEKTHSGGSAWEELCFDFTNETPANTIGLTIIFDNDVLGGAIGGVFEGDWTFYYDDITQVESCSDTLPVGIIPDVSLYDPAADPVIPDDVEVTAFGSQSVIDPQYAVDESYSPVLAVFSGVGYGANVAQIGFLGGDPGFVTFYESLVFKVKGMPNQVVFVSLYEGGQRIRINLSNSGLASELGSGWYQVSIPISSFTGLTTATGIVFESDDTAPMQFAMLLNDIGFTETDDGGGVNPDPGITPDFVLYGTTAPQDVPFPDYVPDVSGPQNFGSGATFDFEFADTTYDPVIAVTAGNGYAPDVWVAFLAVNGYAAGFTNGYDTFNVKVKGSPDGNVEVKFIGAPGEGTDSVATVDVTTYAGSTDLGDGWYQLSIPFSEFSNAGNIPQHNGWLVGPPGDQGDAAFVFLMTDVGFSDSAGGGEGPGTTPDFVLYGTTAAQDVPFPDFIQDISGPQNFGSGATFEFAFSDTTFDPVIAVTAGNGYAPDVWVAFLAVNGYTAGFADGFDTFNVKVKGSPDGNVEIKFIGAPGEGTDSVATVNVTTYAGSTDLGDGWYQLDIPYSEFSNVGNIPLHNGWLVGPPGDQGDAAFVFLMTDVGFSDSTGGGPVEGDLAVNGDFEDGFTGWAQYPSAQTTQTIVVDATTSSNVARLFIPASAGGVNNVLKQERLYDGEGVFSAGDVIQISFDYRGEAGEGILFVKSICETADPVCGDKLHNNGAPFFPAGWTNYTDTFTLGTGVTAYTLEFAAVCGGTGTCVADYFIDNVSITIQ
jgi:hypothetical protein